MKAKSLIFIVIILVLGCGVWLLSDLGSKAFDEFVAPIENERLRSFYDKQNYAFLLTSEQNPTAAENRGYQPLPPVQQSVNKYGINIYRYIFLKLYAKQSGKILTYERVADYLSREYETDGRLRIYYNGSHPDIEDYVVWAQGRKHEMLQYASDLQEYYEAYCQANADRGFESRAFSQLSPQMLDELAKKEANTNYELDLLALQNQGY